MGCNSKGCGCNKTGDGLKSIPHGLLDDRRLKITTTKKIEKGWGYELHIHNDNGYCSKILHFNEFGRFSMHFHVQKHETWYVSKGSFILRGYDADTAELYKLTLFEGDVIDIKPGMIHQLYALEESEIFEASTPDFKEDSFRVGKGDSQDEK